MYCKHCGKELSDEAFMCPNCGAPTDANSPKKIAQTEEPETVAGGVNKTALSVVAFILAMIAFVTGIVFGAFFFEFAWSVLLLYILSASTILPALVSLSIGAYLLCTEKDKLEGKAKAYAIVSVVLCAVVLVFLFLSGSILAANAYYE